jgi:hypothetical protein
MTMRTVATVSTVVVLLLQVVLLLFCMPSDIVSLQIKEGSTEETTEARRSSSKFWKDATQLQPPAASVTAQGEAEGSEWWLEHQPILQLAWKEWEAITLEEGSLPPLNASLIDPILRNSVYQCYVHPTAENEERLLQFWNETISPRQLFSYNNFLTEEGIRAVRMHLDAMAKSEIPTRRPNGMNRFGLLLDPSIPGGVAHSPLLSFLDMLVNDFVRPLGRLFFPAYVQRDDDAQYYAFTIQYSATEDLQLQEHSDASVVSLNLNLNLPEEDYAGSSIYFVTNEHQQQRPPGEKTSQQQQQQQQQHELQFEPGMSLVHRGMLRHGAMPISSGQRHNLVIWLYGKDGSVRFAPYQAHEQLSRKERWSDGKVSQCHGETADGELHFDLL